MQPPTIGTHACRVSGSRLKTMRGLEANYVEKIFGVKWFFGPVVEGRQLLARAPGRSRTQPLACGRQGNLGLPRRPALGRCARRGRWAAAPGAGVALRCERDLPSGDTRSGGCNGQTTEADESARSENVISAWPRRNRKSLRSSAHVGVTGTVLLRLGLHPDHRDRTSRWRDA